MTASSASIPREDDAGAGGGPRYDPGGVRAQPFYLPIADEVDIFMAAWNERLPVLLKGPTGCGKTRFLEYMAWRIRAKSTPPGFDLVTVACHEDLTAGDLIGRFLLDRDGTHWVDGPLTLTVRNGGICYLDEVVEARKDTIVAIHSLTDHRRSLPIAKRGETIAAHEDFLLAVSYNPGYQSSLKDLKPSTRQRFVAIEFDHPTEAAEAEIIEHESGVNREQADALALLGSRARNLDDKGIIDGPSTRLLIAAGRLMGQGISAPRACEVAIVHAVTDDAMLQEGLAEVVQAIFGD